MAESQTSNLVTRVRFSSPAPTTPLETDVLDPIAVPLPDPDETRLTPPTAEEVQVIAGAAITACAPPGGITVTQRAVLVAVTESMTGVAVDVEALPAISADEFGEAMRLRNAQFRTRMLQLMLLGELLLVPLPPEVTARVECEPPWIA